MEADALLASALRDVPVAVVDLELTGLATSDRVCEIAIVRAIGDQVVARYQQLVKPPVPMSSGALAVHGITSAMLAGAPRFCDIAGEVLELLDGAVFVAHNSPFDLGFLYRELAACRRSIAPPITLDTLEMARKLFAFPRNNLVEVSQRLGVTHSEAHRALADAEATFQVYRRMCEVLDPDGAVSVAELSDLLDALAPNSPLRLRQRQVLRDAFRLRRTVLIDYQSTSDPMQGLIPREVAIWALKLPRFQGWCYLRDDERVFRLDRVRQVQPGDREYDVPDFQARI